MIIPLHDIFPAHSNLQLLFSLYADHSSEIRLVGGCVRDALLGYPCGDVDLATPLPPQESVTLLKKQGFSIKTHGLSHGTITVVLHGVPYEITTLRTDQETFGRRARVQFETSWEKDAHRRDFTMNALYLDHQGTIHDFIGGIEDTLKGHVRFVGDPHQRIQEDYLRILRLFRFHAVYGRVPLEPTVLEACHHHRAGVKALSVERIKREIGGLLNCPTPYASLQLMEQTGLFPFLPLGGLNAQGLSFLQELESFRQSVLSSLCRFSILFPHAEQQTQDKNQKKLLTLANRFTPADFDTSQKIKALLYGCPPLAPLLTELYVLVCARHNKSASFCAQGLRHLQIEYPPFPLNGDDVMAHFGLQPGPDIRRLLQQCVEWWVHQSPPPTKEQCLVWMENSCF